jgi:hypothetical protein
VREREREREREPSPVGTCRRWPEGGYYIATAACRSSGGVLVVALMMLQAPRTAHGGLEVSTHAY